MEREKNGNFRRNIMLKKLLNTTKLLSVLMLISPLAGCATGSNCPHFPVPNEHVAEVMDELSEDDEQVKAWGNQLLDLCIHIRS